MLAVLVMLTAPAAVPAMLADTMSCTPTVGVRLPALWTAIATPLASVMPPLRVVMVAPLRFEM